MRAQISILLPTLDAEPHLGRCLHGLMEGLEAGLIRELIVSDGGSRDATGATAQAWGAQVLHGPAGRLDQLGAALDVARGAWVLALDARCVLDQGWTTAVQRHLPQTAAGILEMRPEGGGIAQGLRANMRNWRAARGAIGPYVPVLMRHAMARDALRAGGWQLNRTQVARLDARCRVMRHAAQMAGNGTRTASPAQGAAERHR
ncbi:glycosyltransferase [Sulfitobacter sp. S190]|uniref:glycosyltransferase n=1 Tax=Sulfitobacter sp. S190 TaxID=2867022 RepID=UPI0021A89A23|nr:glycosyltransferase [Sulfitobacter sp. S190]UWR23469.1 glycosyltransferase [Sulfitobacter sp. S190]